MSYQSISNDPFDANLTLGEAYRVMYQFLHDIEDRTPTDLFWVLYSYADVRTDGTTVDPAAADDFLAAARTVLPGRLGGPQEPTS